MTAVHPGPPRLQVELPPRPLTLEDVTQLAAVDKGHRYELVDGNLLVMPPADADHANLIIRIGAWFLVAHHHGLVLATPGLRITEKSDGRIPDLVVVRKPLPRGVVWVDPANVALVIEIVSPGSERIDREIKPGEYARAGIREFWRVERGDGDSDTTVHQYRLGQGERGERAYISHAAVLLDDLLAGAPPALA